MIQSDITGSLKVSKFGMQQMDRLQENASRRLPFIYMVIAEARMERQLRERQGDRALMQKVHPENLDAASKAYLEKSNQQRQQEYDDSHQQMEYWKQTNQMGLNPQSQTPPY